MAKVLSTDEAKDKIYDLTKRLFELEKDKKAEMKSYAEEDKELKNEIQDTYEKKDLKAISEEAAKGRVFEATKKRLEIAKEKKAKAQEYKDEIGDVVSEIFAVFAEQDDQNTAGTNP
jgi:hypothetical protein